MFVDNNTLQHHCVKYKRKVDLYNLNAYISLNKSSDVFICTNFNLKHLLLFKYLLCEKIQELKRLKDHHHCWMGRKDQKWSRFKRLIHLITIKVINILDTFKVGNWFSVSSLCALSFTWEISWRKTKACA